MRDHKPDTVIVNKPAEVNITTNAAPPVGPPSPVSPSSPGVTKMQQVTENLTDDDLKEVAIERLKWENRRKIAWVFSYATIFLGLIILLILVLGTKDISDRIVYATDLLTWVFMGFLSIPALYFGGTVIEKFTGNPSKKT